jgi:hypothetical protein
MLTGVACSHPERDKWREGFDVSSCDDPMEARRTQLLPFRLPSASGASSTTERVAN